MSRILTIPSSTWTEPKFTIIFKNKPPAYMKKPTSKILIDNSAVLHKVSEASEKIHRALNKNIRSSEHNKYFTGDSVYLEKTTDNRY